MPELPEVQTTVNDLKKEIIGLSFVSSWTDWAKMIKRPETFKGFKRKIKGLKILDITRRAKYIIFELSKGKILLIHQKLTGHLLLGKWKRKKGTWQPEIPGPLDDKMNRFIHLILGLSDGRQLAFSDLRKFGKVLLLSKKEFGALPEIKALGPEPLEKSFSFEKFKKALKGQKRAIKQVLMDQTVIAGIGNIYSDEALWWAKIHPEKKTKSLNEEELKRLYQSIQTVLRQGLRLGGESISDYRRPSGQKGEFDKFRKVYRRQGESCPRCGVQIQHLKIGGRSAHFCPGCQAL